MPTDETLAQIQGQIFAACLQAPADATAQACREFADAVDLCLGQKELAPSLKPALEQVGAMFRGFADQLGDIEKLLRTPS